MSLDTLFQQILLTEQQQIKQKQENKKLALAIIECSGNIGSATEKTEKARQQLSALDQQLSVMGMHRDLAKKCKDQMLRQIEELRCQGRQRRDRLATIKWESGEEERNFLREISSFNSDFSLCAQRASAFESRARSEILDLEREALSLHKEMDLMSCRNHRVSSVQEEQRALRLTLQGLDHTQEDLDRQLTEAEATTASLRAESLAVSRRPLTDATCLRLRKELEMHKKGSSGCREERSAQR